MSTINDSDLLCAERSGTLYKVRKDDLSTLQDTDLLAVERSGTLYKIEAQDLGLITGSISTPVEVLTPVNGAGLNAGQTYNPLSSAITNVAGSGTLSYTSSQISTVTNNVNSSQTWSNSGSGTSMSASTGWDKAFDGISGSGNNAFAAASQTMTWQPSSAITVNDKVVLTCYNQSNQSSIGLRVNDTIWPAATNSYTAKIELTSTQLGGSLSKIELITGSNSAGPYLAAIEIDGDLYLDPGATTANAPKTLALAGNTNIDKFVAGASVVQDQAYTPVTDTITGTTTSYETPYKYVSFTASTTTPQWLRTNLDGNKKTGAFAFWFRHDGGSSENMWLFTAGAAGGRHNQLGTNSSSGFYFYSYNGSFEWSVSNNSVNMRDGNWHHLFIQYDTEEAQAADRLKVYFDGSLLSLSGTYPSQHQHFYYGGDNLNNYIGRNAYEVNQVGHYWNGSIAQFMHMNGTGSRSLVIGDFLDSNGNAQASPAFYGSSYTAQKLKFDTSSAGTNSGGGSNFTESNSPTSNQQDEVKVLALSGQADLDLFVVGDTVNSTTETVKAIDASAPSITVSGGTYSNGSTITTTARTVGSGTVDSVSGNNIIVSSPAGVWRGGVGRSVVRNISYDTALTFTDNTDLDEMIGTATQVNTDGTPYNSISTSAITNVVAANTIDVPGTASLSGNIFNGVAGSASSLFSSSGSWGHNRTSGSASIDLKITWSGGLIGCNSFRCTAYHHDPITITYTLEFTDGTTTSTSSTASYSTGNSTEANFTNLGGKIPKSIRGTGNGSQVSFQFTTIELDGTRVESTLESPAVLTFTNNDNFSSFVVGDDYEESKLSTEMNSTYTWSDSSNFNYTSTQVSGSSTGPFNGRPWDDNSQLMWPATNSGTVTWTSPANLTGSLKIHLYSYNNGHTFKVNNVDYTSTLQSAIPSAGNAIYTFPITLNNQTLTIESSRNGSNAFVVRKIYVGDKELVDTNEAANAFHNREIKAVDTSANKITLEDTTASVGDTLTIDFTQASLGTVDIVDGNTLYGSTVAGTFVTGKKLKGPQLTHTAPSPSSIVFTSQNANTTAFSGSGATLNNRVWTLESSTTSSTGPWSTEVSYSDSSMNSSQDGSTAWANPPTLAANTYYRVKVKYEAQNATPVESLQNTFLTGS